MKNNEEPIVGITQVKAESSDYQIKLDEVKKPIELKIDGYNITDFLPEGG